MKTFLILFLFAFGTFAQTQVTSGGGGPTPANPLANLIPGANTTFTTNGLKVTIASSGGGGGGGGSYLFNTNQFDTNSIVSIKGGAAITNIYAAGLRDENGTNRIIITTGDGSGTLFSDQFGFDRFYAGQNHSGPIIPPDDIPSLSDVTILSDGQSGVHRFHADGTETIIKDAADNLLFNFNKDTGQLKVGGPSTTAIKLVTPSLLMNGSAGLSDTKIFTTGLETHTVVIENGIITSWTVE